MSHDEGHTAYHTRSIRPSLTFCLYVDGSGGSGVGWDATLGIDGGGNIDADPLFVGVNDLLLSPGVLRVSTVRIQDSMALTLQWTSLVMTAPLMIRRRRTRAVVAYLFSIWVRMNT